MDASLYWVKGTKSWINLAHVEAAHASPDDDKALEVWFTSDSKNPTTYKGATAAAIRDRLETIAVLADLEMRALGDRKEASHA